MLLCTKKILKRIIISIYNNNIKCFPKLLLLFINFLYNKCKYNYVTKSISIQLRIYRIIEIHLRRYFLLLIN